MSIKVDRAAQRKVSNRIKDLSKRSRDVSPVWPKVGSYLSHANRKQFTSRGAYYDTPWKPLKPEYRRWKLRSGYGRRTLVLTGAMKASFTTRPMSIERYYKKSAVFGSTSELAIFHQYGTRRNGKPAIPARPIMKTTPKVRKTINSMIEYYVVHGKAPYVKDYPL